MWVLLLYYPVARRNFFIITFNWLTNALVYNGLTFYSADLGVSSHLGFFISSAVEIPSYFMGWFVMDKWGRRWCLFLTMMTGGISCICCLFVPIGTPVWLFNIHGYLCHTDRRFCLFSSILSIYFCRLFCHISMYV